MRRRYSYLFFSVFLFFCTDPAISQINIMGKPGYINTPTAEWFEDRPVGFSFGYVPGEYSLFQNKNSIQFYNVRASFTSFFEVNLSIAYRREQAKLNKLGVGDRQLDFRFRLLKEQKYLPSVVLGLTPPGSAAPFLSHDYLVATKNIETRMGSLTVTTGYGSPYVFLKNENSELMFDLNFTNKNSFYGSDYLSGFFAGIAYEPFKFGGMIMEYDSNTFNAGAYIKPWEWLNLQAYTYEGKDWGFSAALNFSLNFIPYSIRKYEKAQD